MMNRICRVSLPQNALFNALFLEGEGIADLEEEAEEEGTMKKEEAAEGKEEKGENEGKEAAAEDKKE